MIDQAISFAALAHAGQKRKYTFDPYIVHPIEVMSIVRSVEPDREDMAVAAILHDVLEDTVISLAELERRFGSEIAEMVVGLTEVEMEGNRAARKAAEVERLAEETYEVQTIKVADMISNSRTIVPFDPGFAKVYLREKRDLLTALVKAHPALVEQAEAILTETAPSWRPE